MITLLSPAKSIQTQGITFPEASSQARLLDDAAYLCGKLKKLSAGQIQKLMHVNAGIADENYERFQQWGLPFTRQNAFPAAAIFTGEVYRGWKYNSLNTQQQAFAQHHIRILSGLYGLLRPQDLIQPYRLEMGVRWKVTPGKDNLYKYWESKIADVLKAEMKDDVVLNLASQEYSKSVLPYLKDKKVYTFHFLDWKDTGYKALMTYAKMARGLMTRFICENQIDDIESLKAFDFEGYHYNPSLSEEMEWVFTRK